MDKLWGNIADQGPVCVVLVLVIFGMGWSLWMVFSRIIWPFVTDRVDRTLETVENVVVVGEKAIREAKRSRVQRKVELAADGRDKAEMHESFRMSLSTTAEIAREDARMLGDKVEGTAALLSGKVEETAIILAQKTEITAAATHEKLEAIHEDVKRLLPKE